ncbi:hypothetical protein POM88_023642 [Heracleum sosnowskyi]|uniref:Uncharacterized protein n=1 Tax=Heracleum sosnowskyi TaxID=360622 RepID=A0AAD8MUM2_9APIA|nr:hypothetical protein POM88_023641 [Heracleum sosnowskyi]KAK1385907.1 hypothetical protein POM88_023642 [Heracleum sosnowskyi]
MISATDKVSSHHFHVRGKVPPYEHTRIKSAVSLAVTVLPLEAWQDLEDLTNTDIISVPVNAQTAPTIFEMLKLKTFKAYYRLGKENSGSLVKLDYAASKAEQYFLI